MRSDPFQHVTATDVRPSGFRRRRLPVFRPEIQRSCEECFAILWVRFHAIRTRLRWCDLQMRTSEHFALNLFRATKKAAMCLCRPQTDVSDRLDV